MNKEKSARVAKAGSTGLKTSTAEAVVVEDIEEVEIEAENKKK